MDRLGEFPNSRASERHDQCVAPSGSRCVVRLITLLFSSACARESFPPWLPPQGRSFSIPSNPSSAYRPRHRLTLFVSIPSSRAISLFVRPSEAGSVPRFV